MPVVNALMKQPVSLSCWGQFEVGRLPVELRAMDHGIVQGAHGEEYLSVFSVGDACRESRVCADRDLNEAEADVSKIVARRLRADLRAVAEMGIDIESIDWDSASHTDRDRERWRTANLGRA